MKIKIDHSIPALTDEEKEAIKDSDIQRSEDNPEEFKQQMLGVDTIVMSPEVATQLEEMGMTPDELVAMFLKKSGTAN